MLAGIVFAIAFFVRIYNLGLLPINHDEAYWARYLLKNPHLIKKIFLIPITAFPPAISNLLSSILPQNKTIALQEFIYHERFIPVLIGSLTVLMVYILAKEMYGRRTALTSSLLLCFLPWHIIQSRIMVQVIWIPLYGCLIFFSLYKAIQAKNRFSSGFWFMFSAFFLISSLSTYESALIFIPAILIVLAWAGAGLIHSSKERAPFMAIVLSFLAGIILFKKRALLLNIDSYFEKTLSQGNLILNFLSNFENNLSYVVKQLFFTPQAGSLIYGNSLKAPLLIHPIILFLALIALGSSFRERKPQDKIILVWLLVSFFGVICGIGRFQAHYMLIIIPPFFIMIGRFISGLFDIFVHKKFRKTAAFISLGLVSALLTLEIIQWGNYYYNAPFDFEESRMNSYGSKQAGEYLSTLTDIEDADVIFDFRMATDVYLNLSLLNKGKNKYFDTYARVEKKKNFRKAIYYCVWAGESHPKEYWNSLFSTYYLTVNWRYPDKKPLKTFFYPGGSAAINIFRIEGSLVE